MLLLSNMRHTFSSKVYLFASLLWVLCSLTAQGQSVVVTPLHTFNTRSDTGSPFRTYITSLLIGKFDGSLYGTTYADQTNGTIFTINTDGSGYSVLHTFAPADEAITPSGYDPSLGLPEPRVIQGSDGHLYGTTPSGGAFGQGTIFRLNPNGTSYTVIHDFDSDGGPANIMQASDGAFYGAGSTIFRIDGNGNNYTALHFLDGNTEGYSPYGTLLQANDGALYGTTCAGGGTNNGGSLFTIKTNGTGFKVLHTFGNNEGARPLGSLIQGSDGALYGTTSQNGTNGNLSGSGAIFKINTDGNNYQILHVFAGGSNDGSLPIGSLVEGANHVLYGTTYSGGNGNTYGTIYKIGFDGSSYAPLYFFTNNISSPLGTKPLAGLVIGPTQGNVGVLYGATSQGPTTSLGAATVFAMLVNPPLSITPVVSQTGSNQATLFWPAWAAKFSLQSTTNPASGNWTSVTDAVPVYGAQVTTTNPAVFYRLVSP